MTMLSLIKHSSTTLLAVGESRNNSENFISNFPSKCSKSLTNFCLRVDIYMRGIDNFLKKLNVYNSISCAINCDISH